MRITDEMVKAACMADLPYCDCEICAGKMRKSLEAALLAALAPVEPVAVSAPSDAAKIGWNACRKSIYAVCEAVTREAEAIPTNELEHARGYSAGMARAAKYISRAFNSIEAGDDDNFVCAVSQVAMGVVRTLDWYPDPGAFPYPSWGAQSSFGRFIIEEVSASDSPAYEVRYTPHHLIAVKDNLEDAKAAAQSDYERRIRSALTSPPSAPSEDDLVAAREAAAQNAEARHYPSRAVWIRAGDGDHLDEVQSALIAIRNERAGGGK